MKKPCSTCRGTGMVTFGGSAQKCPMCEGTGVEYDPGRPYTYELGPLTVAGGVSLSFQSVEVLNYPFRWQLAESTQTFPFTVQVLDSRDQRPFSNQQVHNQNIFGTAQRPFPLLTPFEFMRGSFIQANITDLGGGQGTVTVTNGSNAVVYATGTPFVTIPSGQPGSWVGQTIIIGGVSYTISAVTDLSHLTISPVYAGASSPPNVAFVVNNNIRLSFSGVELRND